MSGAFGNATSGMLGSAPPAGAAGEAMSPATSTSRVRRSLETIAWARILFISLGAALASMIVVELARAGGLLPTAGMRLPVVIASMVGVVPAIALAGRSGRISELRAALW